MSGYEVISHPCVVVPNISRTPIITTERLNGENYFSWPASVKMLFRGREVSDHLIE